VDTNTQVPCVSGQTDLQSSYAPLRRPWYGLAGMPPIWLPRSHSVSLSNSSQPVAVRSWTALPQEAAFLSCRGPLTIHCAATLSAWAVLSARCSLNPGSIGAKP
jgi:hypothetical protein